MRRPASDFWRVWRAPLLIAALTMLGLLAALLGDHAFMRWVLAAGQLQTKSWYARKR